MPLLVPRLATVLLLPRGPFALARASSSSAPPPAARPSPPKLPRADQREFDRLVAAASTGGAFSTPPSSSPSSSVADAEEALHKSATGLHPDARKTPKADFEGDRNPVTGERGGPKKDPLVHREWTYGGRATDF